MSLVTLDLSARGLAGVKVGANITNFVIDDGYDNEMDPTVGGFVGFFFTSEITPNFAIQPELNISQKGAQESNVTIDFVTDDLKYFRYYLEIPLLFKLQFPSEVSTFSIYAGPYIAFLTKETLEFGGEEEDISGYTTTKDTDYGFIVGASLDFNMNEMEAFTIDFRYAMGAVSTNSNLPYNPKNSAFSILVGYGWAY